MLSQNYRPLRVLFVAINLLLLALLCATVKAQVNEYGLTPQEQAKVDALYKQVEPTFRLAPIPKITLSPYIPPTAAEAAHIKDLIRYLADIDTAKLEYLEYSTYESGHPSFEPLPAAANPAEPYRWKHPVWGRRPGPSSPFVELVRLGPRALPLLLASLDDPTPGKLVEKIGWGVEYFEDVPVNPANTREMGILAKRNIETGWRTFLQPRKTPSNYKIIRLRRRAVSRFVSGISASWLSAR